MFETLNVEGTRNNAIPISLDIFSIFHSFRKLKIEV